MTSSGKPSSRPFLAALFMAIVLSFCAAAYVWGSIQVSRLDQIARAQLIASSVGSNAAGREQDKVVLAKARQELVAVWSPHLLALQPLNPRLVNAAVQAPAMSGAARSRDDIRRRAAILDQLGWRDTTVLQNRLTFAAERRDVAEVVDLLDALLRRNRAVQQTTVLFNAIELIPDGQEFLVRRLSGNPPWRRSYLMSGATLSSAAQLAARAKLLSELQRKRIALDYAEIAPVLAPMVSQGLVAEAARIWSKYRGEEVLAPLSDTGFDRFARKDVGGDWDIPFDWKPNAGLGYSVSSYSEGDDALVRIDWNGKGVPTFLSQQLSSLPEDHEVVLTVASDRRQVAAALDFIYRCPNSRHVLVANNGPRRNELRYRLDEPVGCRFPQLEVAGRLQPSAAASPVSGLGGSRSISAVLSSIGVQ